jgi:hypothetical protein
MAFMLFPFLASTANLMRQVACSKWTTDYRNDSQLVQQAEALIETGLLPINAHCAGEYRLDSGHVMPGAMPTFRD